jgi:hypothetical protein
LVRQRGSLDLGLGKNGCLDHERRWREGAVDPPARDSTRGHRPAPRRRRPAARGHNPGRVRHGISVVADTCPDEWLLGNHSQERDELPDVRPEGALTKLRLAVIRGVFTCGIALSVFAPAIASSPAVSGPRARPGHSREAKMKGTLVLAVLNVKSSYLRRTEEPVREGDVPDTLQWWIAPNQVWRIKTFATDHDIHVYSVGAAKGAPVELAQANNRKHYGDVIRSEHVLTFDDCTDLNAVAKVLGAAGIGSELEVAPAGFAFWKPDDAEYRSQSKPEHMMKAIQYRGGVVRFRIPADWREEYGEDGGGTFYPERERAGTLRLSILTFEGPDIPGREELLRALRRGGVPEWLPTGNALAAYTSEAEENGVPLTVSFWELANGVAPRHLRVAVFSYTVETADATSAEVQADIKLLDAEIRAATFASELGVLPA